MRRSALRLTCAVLVLAACSSGTKSSVPATTTPASGPGTLAAITQPSVTAQSTTTGAVATTTVPACPGTRDSTSPVSTGTAKPALLLLTASVNSTSCSDRVVFAFSTKSRGVPSCSVGYKNGPFSQDGSGAPVTVAGTAFVLVRCSPAYGYDFNTGRTTYTGPKHVPAAGTHHVRELAETGDSEGVVTWVVGVDGQRPFGVTANTIPPGLSTLVITFS